jgi:hypothetical protein
MNTQMYLPKPVRHPSPNSSKKWGHKPFKGANLRLFYLQQAMKKPWQGYTGFKQG